MKKTILLLSLLLLAAGAGRIARAQSAFSVSTNTTAFFALTTNTTTRPLAVTVFFNYALTNADAAVNIRAMATYGGTNTNTFHWRGGVSYGPGLAATNIGTFTFYLPRSTSNPVYYVTNTLTGAASASTRTNFIHLH